MSEIVTEYITLGGETIPKLPKLHGKHMIIEIKDGAMLMNEFTCKDLLRKVRDNCNISETNNNGLMTYRDCKQILSDVECIPNIDTRFKCILVRLFPISCIILEDSVLVVVNGNMNMDDFIKGLCRITRLYHCNLPRACSSGASDSLDMHSGLLPTGTQRIASDETEPTPCSTLPFEVSVLEHCYATAISHLEEELMTVENKFMTVERMASQKKKYKDISIIIHELKQPTTNITEIVMGFNDMMNDILNSPENMKILEFRNHSYFYGNETGNTDFEDMPLNRDLEILLEYFDQEVDQLAKRSRTLGNSLTHLERHINMELAITRNEIMRLELMTSIVGASFGAGACLSGLFGMNVVNGLENSHSAFLFISIIALIFLLLSAFLTKVLIVKHRV